MNAALPTGSFGQNKKPRAWYLNRVPPAELFEHTGPQPMLFEEIIPAECVTLFGGAGGIGKTTIVLTLALCILTQRNLFNSYAPSVKGHVIMFLGEDSAISCRRMLQRISKAMCLSSEEQASVSEHLHLIPLSGMHAKLTVRDPNTRQLAVSPDIESMCIAYKSDPHISNVALVIVDPLLRFHSGMESANEDGDVLIEAANLIQNMLQTTVMLVAHTNKEYRTSRIEDGLGNAFRGASSTHDGARHAQLIMPLSDYKAKEWEVHKDVRGRWIELTNPKANLTENHKPIILVRSRNGLFEPGTKGKPKPRQKRGELIDSVIEKIESESARGKTHSRHSFCKSFGDSKGPLKAGKHAVEKALKDALESGRLNLGKNNILVIPINSKASWSPSLPSGRLESGREGKPQ